MSDLLTVTRAKTLCAEALEKRFGCLRRELALKGGNLNELPATHQLLWFGRQKAIGRYNRIGEQRDPGKRERAYLKLARELQR